MQGNAVGPLLNVYHLSRIWILSLNMYRIVVPFDAFCSTRF